MTTASPPRGRRHDRNAILDWWAAGEDSVFIANRVGSSPGYIRTIIKIAREEGDARAEPGGRLPDRGRIARTLDHEGILDRWSDGWSVVDLARFAGTTPRTIYDLVIGHRRRGDSRATRRRRMNGEG